MEGRFICSISSNFEQIFYKRNEFCRDPFTFSFNMNGGSMSIRAGDYDPEHPSMNYTPASASVLLEAARCVLSISDELYDPELYAMNISPENQFKYEVNMVFWHMALQETKNTRALHASAVRFQNVVSDPVTDDQRGQ